MQKNILFFIPYNQQVVYIESIAQHFQKNGENIHLLTYDGWGPTHDNFQKFGAEITCLSQIKLKLPLIYHFLRILQVLNYCRKSKIDLVYSHYQEANFISVVAQYFTKAKFIITRHHSDCAIIDDNIKERIGDKIINRLSKVYVAPSKLVYDQIVKTERTNASKVHLINYGYRFLNFAKVDPKNVSKIKRDHDAKMLIVMAARFIPEKRHNLLIEVVAKLLSEGLDIKVLLLSKGPLYSKVQALIKAKEMDKNIFLVGYKNNVQDYFSAADLVVHLSISEASNSAIKEAALTETPVAVCENVGDFSDYIFDKQNGYILNKKSPSSDLESLLKEVYNSKEAAKQLGKNLKEEVLRRFDVENVMPNYYKLHDKLFNGKN